MGRKIWMLMIAVMIMRMTKKRRKEARKTKNGIVLRADQRWRTVWNSSKTRSWEEKEDRMKKNENESEEAKRDDDHKWQTKWKIVFLLLFLIFLLLLLLLLSMRTICFLPSLPTPHIRWRRESESVDCSSREHTEQRERGRKKEENGRMREERENEK